jgi:hypothetical protein
MYAMRHANMPYAMCHAAAPRRAAAHTHVCAAAQRAASLALTLALA